MNLIYKCHNQQSSPNVQRRRVRGADTRANDVVSKNTKSIAWINHVM
jgi:hypothetical protein